MSARKVIVDTDPGLDDAIAILFALGSFEFEIVGLTTVAGNIGLERTTANALGLLAVCARGDIPVVMGAERPLKRWGLDVVAIHGNDGMGGVVLPEPLANARSDAIGWMAKQLEASPAGTLDILALGPLTNIARLVRQHPGAADRIGRLIVMGGTVNEPGNAGPRSEFNFASDPEAVAIVLHSGVPTTLVPLDVTRQVRAGLDDVKALRGTPHGDMAASILEAYFQDGRLSRPLHDPCVMVLALAPELFKIETLTVTLDLGDDADAGAVLVDRSGVSVDVALGVNAERVLARLKAGFV